jgi:hypothetical protein
LGRDIVFGKGQYAPGTVSGRHLLAHELTHTLQQKGSCSNVIRRSPNSITMVSSIPLAKQGNKNYLAGILTEMYVGTDQTCSEDFDGATIEEVISPISQTCPGSSNLHTATFTVGKSYNSNTFGTFPGKKNTFYDGHFVGIRPRYLPYYRSLNCHEIAKQIYKSKGTPIAEFKLKRTYGQPGAKNLANLSTVKTEINDCLSCP